MAGIIGLFLSSLCVIKVVRKLSYFFSYLVPTVLAETRVRAFQEDRRKTWGEGICLGSKKTSIPPSSSVTSKSVLRIPATLDNILSACLAFETIKSGKIAFTIAFSLLSQFFSSLL